MKKWLFVAMALILTSSGMLAGCSGGKTEGGKPIGVIEVPGGPKIEVVYADDFPEELELNWETIGMSGFQLSLWGTLKNTSDKILSFDQIAFVLDGEKVGHWPLLGICTLRPHEEEKFGWGGVGYSEYSKVLEVKIIGFEDISGSAQEVVTIQISDGLRIDLVYGGPPELKIKWEELDLWWGISGTIKNVSNQTVRFNRIAFILDGQEINHWPSVGDCILESGEERKFESGGLGYSEFSKLLEAKIEEFEVLGGSATTPTPVSSALFEVANFDLSELIELRNVVGEVLTQAKLIASEDERRLLTQADTVLGAIKSDSEIQDIVREKTQQERLILDTLSMVFAEGLKYWAKVFYYIDIPSPVGEAIAKGAEELGNRLAEWWWLGDLSLVKISQTDGSIAYLTYDKSVGEVWANFDIYDPVGRVYMYIPVELRLVSPEGGGNIVLSEGVRPVMEKCRITYRFGGSEPTTPEQEMTPGEVAVRFYYLLNEGKYNEAEMLLSLGGEDFSKLFPEAALESFNEEFFQSRQLNNIDVGRIQYKEEGTEAIIHYIEFYFEDGSYVVFDDGIELVLENGVWKMEEYCY